MQFSSFYDEFFLPQGLFYSPNRFIKAMREFLKEREPQEPVLKNKFKYFFKIKENNVFKKKVFRLITKGLIL